MRRHKNQFFPKKINRKFLLGYIHVGPSVRNVLSATEETVMLLRHQSGDWGIVGKKISESNEIAVTRFYKIISLYITQTGSYIEIKTNAERSFTTVQIRI